MHHFRCLTSALLLCVALAAVPARAATPEDVDKAIAKGVTWIYAQEKDGNWENPGVHNPKSDSITPFTAYTLICAGENPRDPRIVSAIDYLLKRPPVGVYGAAVRLVLWSRLGLTKQIRPVAEKDTKYLLGAMKTQGTGKGLYWYVPPANPADGTYDLSCSQFAVLGLWSAAHAGIEIPGDFWKVDHAAWCGKQLPEGSWFYEPDAPLPTASMTAAGVASLLIADEQTHLTAECRGNLQDPNVDRGIEWLSNNFDHVFDPKFYVGGGQFQWYTCFGLSRIGVLSGQKYFGKYDWYNEASNRLLAAQLPDGSWAGIPAGGVPPIGATLCSVAALCYGSAPVVINKLQYALTPADGKPAEARWNQRPLDMRNYVDWMMRQLEGRFNWQQLNLASASMDDLHEAPIAYISGDQDLKLSADDRARLKLFVEQGGLILGNPDCQRDKFIAGFQALGTEMFPQYKFRELPETHILLAGEEFPARKWKRKIRLIGLSNGVRELMLIPDVDLSCAFQTRSETISPESYQLLDDVVLYAVDKSGLSKRGGRRLLKPDSSIATTRTVKLARLQYAGNWDPEPQGWQRLSAVLHNTLKTALQVETVKLGDGKLTTPPTTAAVARPTDKELRQLAAKRIPPADLAAMAVDDPQKLAATINEKIAEINKELDAADAARAAGTVNYPIAHMTGTAQFKLTDAEIQDLKKYVQGGGTLVIDAAGGSTEFAASAEQMLRDAFGDDERQIESPLSPDAAVYQLPGRAVGKVQYRQFARSRISTATMPQLRGITLNGRLAVIYSREDLSAGLVGEPMDGITGYSPASATELMTDIILFAKQ